MRFKKFISPYVFGLVVFLFCMLHIISYKMSGNVELVWLLIVCLLMLFTKDFLPEKLSAKEKVDNLEKELGFINAEIEQLSKEIQSYYELPAAAAASWREEHKRNRMLLDEYLEKKELLEKKLSNHTKGGG